MSDTDSLVSLESIAVVIPCYNEAAAIAACDHARLRKLAPRLLRAQTKAGIERVLGGAKI